MHKNISVEYFKIVFETCKQAIKSIRQRKDRGPRIEYERVVGF